MPLDLIMEEQYETQIIILTITSFTLMYSILPLLLEDFGRGGFYDGGIE